MASEPISGADILMEGEYCGVIVVSKSHPSNDSESVQMVIGKLWRFRDVTGTQLEQIGTVTG